MKLDWLKTNVNTKILGFFLVGLLVGGITMGFVDSKRPKPLFSKADSEVIAECSEQVQILEDFVDNIPLPIDDPYNILLNSTIYLFNTIARCVYEANTAQQQQFLDDVRAIRQEIAQRAPHREELRYAAAMDRYEAEQAEAAYQRCLSSSNTNTPADRAGTGQNTDESLNSFNSTDKLAIESRTTETDCETLRHAAELAREEAGRSEAALNDYDDYTSALEDQIDELTLEREQYNENAQWTLQYSEDYYRAVFFPGSGYRSVGGLENKGATDEKAQAY